MGSCGAAGALVGLLTLPSMWYMSFIVAFWFGGFSSVIIAAYMVYSGRKNLVTVALITAIVGIIISIIIK